MNKLKVKPAPKIPQPPPPTFCIYMKMTFSPFSPITRSWTAGR